MAKAKGYQYHYTLVQHSGWTGGGKPEFKRAVELRSLAYAREVAAVRSVGGLVFDDYQACQDAEQATNYPPGVEGLIPRCEGGFASRAGMSIYVPVKP